MDNYYNLLGVSKNATESEIKSAYRTLAKKYHPDVNKNPNDLKIFKDITCAYDTLKSSEKRREYDMPTNTQTFTWPNSSDMSSGFNDIFNNIFGGHQRQPTQNSDIQFQYAITLEEAYNGTVKTVNARYPNGEVIDLEFNVPPGIQNNSRIKLSKKGPIINKALPPGDIYIIIAVVEHSKFCRNGADLLTAETISSIDAMLGINMNVQLLDGKKVNVIIPAGTQPNSRIRVKQKGMPVYNTNNVFGDLYIEIKLHTPINISEYNKQLLLQIKNNLKT